MKLDREQVRHVANLARLSFSEDEEQRLRAQLSAILDAVDELSKVDTSGVEPTTSVLAGEGRARPDEVTGHLSTAQALGNAPQAVGTSFAIPRVIE